ncbi:hypothetical protein [Cupriavidus malaysiensis]|uniref:Uncharacterized protein n=1 Tax=Cupriavidus malaysiensis TaxID=367825 RepID=A0ABM6F384_9BURK|nr:hypothetical protein [Cupriavidus malaysiensis]AOZ05879.1 hypothetical protein BKK80_08645 [Cupriavidus malaysiensis]
MPHPPKLTVDELHRRMDERNRRIAAIGNDPVQRRVAEPNPSGGYVMVLKSMMPIDAVLLDKLVRAGVGKDHAEVVDNALRLAELLSHHHDEHGDVHVQNHDPDGPGVIAVHVVEPT